MKYYIVDVFTDQPFGGNPAGVVLLDGNSFPSETLMLQIAAELRYSETAFVRRDSEKEFTIRYFTPMAEVDLCGHATIASFALLHRVLGVTGWCLCHAKAGDIHVEAGPRVLMQMTPSEVLKTIEDTEEVYRALGICDYTPALPMMIVSTGLPDFMIQVEDVETLNRLPLDMNAISAVTEKHNAVSFHVFAFGNDGYTAHVRDFGPLYGVPEESATGTANASLTHYLQRNGCIPATGDFSFLQGEAMGRPSVVNTRVTPDGVIYVGGTATVVAEGELVV
ncbi:MAG: PhzF family phenazine biosynthesis protein [Bacteroidales bacterium]|nr:PhzF family phenazine biosynthesis protein [Bacteroidales bacterium]